ncbi:hypothetical protein ACQJBY_043508 [Aegilops geniculata]
MHAVSSLTTKACRLLLNLLPVHKYSVKQAPFRSEALPSLENARLARAPATGGLLFIPLSPRRPPWPGARACSRHRRRLRPPWRRGHGCFFFRRGRSRQVPRRGCLQREGLVFPADSARAGAAEHRGRAHPAEPDHASAAVARPAGVPRAISAVHPAAARPAAAASFADTAGAAVAVPSPPASAAAAAVHPPAVDPWRAASFLLEERPTGETMRKMLVFLPYELSIYCEILYWKYSTLWLCTVHV